MRKPITIIILKSSHCVRKDCKFPHIVLASTNSYGDVRLVSWNSNYEFFTLLNSSMSNIYDFDQSCKCKIYLTMIYISNL